MSRPKPLSDGPPLPHFGEIMGSYGTSGAYRRYFICTRRLNSLLSVLIRSSRASRTYPDKRKPWRRGVSTPVLISCKQVSQTGPRS